MLVWLLPCLDHPPRGRPILLQASDPFLHPASTLLSILLLPSCYLGCHAAPGPVCHCPHGMLYRMRLPCAQPAFSQATPTTGRDGDARHEPGVQNPSPAFLGYQTPSKPSSSLHGRRAVKRSQAVWLPAAPAAPFAARVLCFRAQHTNQMDPNSLPIPHCALGWQVCGGERSGLTVSRLSVFLPLASIQRFCCQPGILK